MVHHAFAVLDLSRIEAACLPENAASRALLERSGFKYEGVAQSYLQINGRWRNHVLYANLRSDRRGRRGGGDDRAARASADAGGAGAAARRRARAPGAVAAPEPRYLEEPRGRFHGQAAAVLRPASTAEVAAAVAVCAAARVGIVPYSGGTGLVGGQMLGEGPLPVILSLRADGARSATST